MYSKFSNGFFGKQRFYSSNIIKALTFSLDEHAQKKLKDFESKKEQLSERIRKNNEDAILLRGEFSTICNEENALKEPFLRSEKIKRDIKEIRDIIVNEIQCSLLNGKTTAQFLKPGNKSHIHNEYFAFFKTILTSYGMTMNESPERKKYWVEYVDICFDWNIDFPKQFCKTSLPFKEGETKYNEWLLSFDQQISLALEKVEAQIAEDSLALKEELQESVRGELVATQFKL